MSNILCFYIRCIDALQGSAPGEAEHYMGLAKETIEQLKSFAMDLRQQGQPNDNVVRTWGRPLFLSSSTDPYCHSIYLFIVAEDCSREFVYYQ